MNDLPVKTVNGATVYMRDVAHVRDGFAAQTNIVRTDGQRGALLTVLQERQRLHARHRQARQEQRCRRSRATLPPELKISRCSINRFSCARRSTAWCAKAVIAAVPHRR